MSESAPKFDQLQHQHNKQGNSMTWLDNSRILAIYAVVFLHVAADVVMGNEVGSRHWWVGNVYDSAVRWCVPVFVMISGALLLGTRTNEDAITFYNKRLARILAPIIVWSLLFLAWSAFKDIQMNGDARTGDLIARLVSGKPYYHMWFLYMIVGLYTFTPFLQKVVATSTKGELIFLITAGFLLSAINSAYGAFAPGKPTLFLNWFLSFIPYFLLGHIIREDQKQYSRAHLWAVFCLSVLFTSLGCYFVAVKTNLSTGLYFYSYLSITVIPMSVSAMYLLKTVDKPIVSASVTKKLSTLTLGVYLIHPIILELAGHAEYGVNLYQPLVSVPLVATFGFLASLVFAWCIYHAPVLKRII